MEWLRMKEIYCLVKQFADEEGDGCMGIWRRVGGDYEWGQGGGVEQGGRLKEGREERLGG